MRDQVKPNNIISYELIGFTIIILLIWMDEIFCLPTLLFGGLYTPDYHEAVVETSVALLVAVPVIHFTKKLLNRLHYLEGLLRVCAWCKKIGHDGQWISLEKYFEHQFDTKTSHGICPECSAKMLETDSKLDQKIGAYIAINQSTTN